MTIQDICKIGKVEMSDENIDIISKYSTYIIDWLKSDEFKEYANKEYPPLINTKKMDYEGSDPAHAWLLNIPLPNYYDFVAFGSHAVGLHGAIIGFLALCGVTRKAMTIINRAIGGIALIQRVIMSEYMLK